MPESAKVNRRKADVAAIVARICFLVVFALNVQCALGFIFWPESFAGAYGLSGVVGNAAIQGIGVAFLMWNATYPAFIIFPRRFKVLGWVIIAQQLIGLIGESCILVGLLGLPDVSSYSVLASSIERFIAFDAGGLLIMSASFAFMLFYRRKEQG